MEGLPVKEWRRESFLVSTDVSLIDMEALNSALASDSMPWAVGLPEDLLLTALRSSLCLGLYHYPEKGNHEDTARRMVGFARVVTDFVTFGYVTDVYVLEEFRGLGLGKWMMECLGEHTDQWPFLRRMLLFTITPKAADLYKKNAGFIDFEESPSSNLIMLEKRGKGIRI